MRLWGGRTSGQVTHRPRDRPAGRVTCEDHVAPPGGPGRLDQAQRAGIRPVCVFPIDLTSRSDWSNQSHKLALGARHREGG